jgi:hypothetical protein
MSGGLSWSGAEDTYLINKCDGHTYKEIAKDLNKFFHAGNEIRTERAVINRVYDLRNNRGSSSVARDVEPIQPRERKEWGEDGSTLVTSNRAFSDDEMAEMFGVDMSLWKVTKRVTNVWGAQTQTKLWWAPIELNHVAQNWDAMLEDFQVRSLAGKSKLSGNHKHQELFEICLFDAHIGMAAWGQETGEDYDLDIGMSRLYNAFQDLLDRAPQGSKILLILGNDLFHFDNLIDGKGGATHRGTPQDVDSRWQKLFVRTCATVCEMIEDALENHDVDVVVVPGNHDTQTSYYCGEYVSAYFRNHEGFRIDNSPSQRKYYHFGNVNLGFTHGHEEKIKDLFRLMAEECNEYWSDTHWREWHRGHVHQEECSEDGTMRIRTMPAITGRDAWHDQKGYAGLAGARAFLWTRYDGIKRVEYYNVPRTQTLTDYRGAKLTS